MRNKTIENVVKKLKNEGIDVEEIRLTKNNVPCEGVRILRKDSLSPIIYYSSGESMEEFRAKIDAALDMQSPSFDLSCLQDANYIRNHVFVCIQRKGTENILKRDYLDLEVFIRLQVEMTDGIGSLKLSPSHLFLAGVTDTELWCWAIDNSRESFRIQTMAEAIGLSEEIIGESPFFVVSSPDKLCGASSLYFPEVFRRFCEEMDQPYCFILPSSTEEVLVLNANMATDAESLAEMVASVNGTAVDPILRLEASAYRYDMDTNTISIAAKCQNANS